MYVRSSFSVKRSALLQYVIRAGNNTFKLDDYMLEDRGVSMTGSSINKIILGKLLEGFRNSLATVSGLKSEGGCPFLIMKFA